MGPAQGHPLVVGLDPGVGSRASTLSPVVEAMVLGCSCLESGKRNPVPGDGTHGHGLMARVGLRGASKAWGGAWILDGVAGDPWVGHVPTCYVWGGHQCCGLLCYQWGPRWWPLRWPVERAEVQGCGGVAVILPPPGK